MKIKSMTLDGVETELILPDKESDESVQPIPLSECIKKISLAVKSYERDVERLGCIYANKHGVCSKLSDDTSLEYCSLTPCPHYKEKNK